MALCILVKYILLERMKGKGEKGVLDLPADAVSSLRISVDCLCLEEMTD